MGVDLSALLSMDEPTAQEKAAALASALRRKQAVGTLASLIGGPAAGFGANLTRQSEQGLAQLSDLPGQRLQMALQKQRVASGAADAEQQAIERTARNDPGSSMGQVLRALVTKQGLKVSPNATATELLPVEPFAAKMYGIDENARQRALTRQALGQRASSITDSLVGEPLDMMARKYLADGIMPAFGQGAAGAALKVAMLKRAAELGGPGVDLAGAAQAYKANTASLTGLQKQADAINAFERTALANGDLFMQKARALGIDTGSPLFNAPARKFAEAVAGDPRMTEFATTRQVFVQEISKILSGAMGNTAVSDSARHEAMALLSPDASLAQIEAAFNVLKQDMENRKAGMQAQLAEVRGRTGGGGNTPAPAPIPSTSGKVRVTNGTETLEIDPADLPEAERDGYRRAP